MRGEQARAMLVGLALVGVLILPFIVIGLKALL